MRTFNVTKAFSALVGGAILGLGSVLSASAATFTIPVNYSYSNTGLPDFYTYNTSFNLPAGYTNASLNITTMHFDDRGVVQLNGAIVTGSGILTSANNFGPQGFMILTSGGPIVSYTFPYEYFSSTFAPITSGFQTGINTLDIIVNDTSGGLAFRGGLLSGGYFFLNGIQQSYGAPTSAEFHGTVTYDLADPGQTPLPAALPLFATGLGAFGLIAYRKKRKQA